MAKVEVDLVRKALDTTVGIEVRPRNEVMEKIKQVLEREALEDEMKPPAIKKEFVILIADKNGKLFACELVGWVLQIPEGESPATLLDKINCCAAEHNASPMGRKFPVESVGEALESVGPKITKEYNVWFKTKLPAQVITTDNKLSQNAKAGYVDEADEARTDLMRSASRFTDILTANNGSLSINGKAVVDFTNPPTTE